MADIIPAHWRSSVERLRDSIKGAFDRCLTKFKRHEEDLATWSPAILQCLEGGIELSESDAALIARLALPGLSRGEFKVEVTQDRLFIRGGKKQSGKKEQRGYYHLEENRAAFAHAISLPCEIDRDRVKARYKNGLLTVTLPKRDDARSRNITIPVITYFNNPRLLVEGC